MHHWRYVDTLNIETAGVLVDLIKKLPKENYNDFENKQFDKIDTISISLHRLVDYLIQVNLIEPFRTRLNELPHKFEKTIIVTEDVVRLISFILSNPEHGYTPAEQVGLSIDSQ